MNRLSFAPKLLLIALLALQQYSVSCLADGSPAVVIPAQEKFHLFLLAGQSNMAGRGKVSEEDKTPHPRVLMLNRDNQWVPAIDPLHFDKSVAGTGLGKTFGILMAEHDPNVTIGLIPCAVGGTDIAKWEPGAFDKATKAHPWDDCMARVKVAAAAGTFKGILWHQGEGDCTPERAAIYASKLKELIQRFRTELHAPELPFILGELGQFSGKPATESSQVVRDAIHQVAQEVPGTAVVSSSGLKDKGDKTHFDAASYREFGRRYAEAYLKLTGPK